MPEEAESGTRLHRLVVPIVFPAGAAPGSGDADANLLRVARRGDDFVLRGTAIAGVLRHGLARSKGAWSDEAAIRRWFGYALGDAGDGHVERPSRIRVADARLEHGRIGTAVRSHNSIDRHTGAVRDGGLFSVEALPPGTSTELVITLHCEAPDDSSEGLNLLRALVTELERGLFFGGNSARGIGLARLDGARGAPTLRTFHLERLDEHAAWLDESWASRSGRRVADGAPFEPTGAESALRVELELVVPRGQDLCIGDDTGVDFQLEPQQALHVSGRSYWRIPGSSLRGVFRSWVTRLAARSAAKGDCPPPLDTPERFLAHGRTPARGDDNAWAFMSEEGRVAAQNELLEDPSRLNVIVRCPVLQLFGSLFNAGRIHVSDFFSTEPVSDRRLQVRKHVAVDRVTGGASEGLLFDHRALIAGVRFRGTLVVHQPGELEASWLAETLRAVDLGVLRVGSSKSSGRLALAAAPVAVGPHAALFTALQPSESPS